MKGIIFILAVLMLVSTLQAQIPDIIPSGEPTPPELTLFNIVLYFVLPAALFVFYFWYRRSKRKNRKK